MKPQFKPTQDQLSAAKAVLIARAFVETLRPGIEKIHAEVIDIIMPRSDVARWTKNGRNCLPENEQEFILKWDHLYLATDEDSRKCFDLNNRLMKEAGYKVRLNYCPLLIAEDNQRKAERLLVESMEPVTKISAEQALYSLPNYKKLVELTLRLLVPLIDKKELAF